MHFSTHFAALLAILSTLVAVQGVPTDDKHSKCASSQFYYQERDCCLPNGGPEKYYPVPEGKQCPGDYYWYHEKDCCVPKYAKYEAPKCAGGLVWAAGCCEKHDDHKATYDDGKWYPGKYEGGKYDDGKWYPGKYEGWKYDDGKYHSDDGKYDDGKYDGDKYDDGKYDDKDDQGDKN